jgi:hypothetical protein
MKNKSFLDDMNMARHIDRVCIFMVFGSRYTRSHAIKLKQNIESILSPLGTLKSIQQHSVSLADTKFL